jgi:hypothetical protein
MVQFLCFQFVFCVFLDVSHQLFFINNLKILNYNFLKKVVLFCVFAGWKRVFSASLSLRIWRKMVQFLCFEVTFCVVLNVNHHLFFIINLKIMNSNVLNKVVIFCVIAGWKRDFSATISLRIREKMVQFLCFEVVLCVVLDVSYHLFFINKLKILNSNVLNAFYQHLFLWG